MNIKDFNPDDISVKGKLFGLPFTKENAKLVIMPVPWEVTVSYKPGTANVAEAILNASYQVDLYDTFFKEIWSRGIYLDEIPLDILKNNDVLRQEAEKYISFLESGADVSNNKEMLAILNKINAESESLNKKVKEKALKYLANNQFVATIGGEHSTPLGLMQALAEKYSSFGILHIDAHSDLRDAYEGFEYSHASIMFNALKLSQISKLVQVGIRDYGKAEAELISNSKGRVRTFYDNYLKEEEFNGTNWAHICDDIINSLPEKVYISFDIDGLKPYLCPNTGTPVPGGLEFECAEYLLKKLVESGKKIIGFDLSEVGLSEDEWDENVGSRILYKLSCCLLMSNER